jgi:predicted ATPase/class 3 adenylate cyclase
LTRTDLPTGTVTFLFTDIEGSTRLLNELGADQYAHALAEHRRVLRAAFAARGGVEVDTQGDAFFVAFPTAEGAMAAAAEAQAELAQGAIRARMGVHTGAPLVTDEGYVGPDVHRAARVAAAGHGGQVLLTSATAGLAGADLADLGLHRLKDLSAPERIFQLGHATFPPLRTLYQTNLPVPGNPFLGRQAELAELGALLIRTGVRIVTLTGPGGTGKTRLAQQSAAEVGDQFDGGVWWVPLAQLRDPALVIDTIRSSVGARDGLADRFGSSSALLVLDNFEQVLDAAPAVAEAISAAPGVRLLATSREPLHLAGEHEFPVPPLAQSDAVNLFSARAMAADPAFEDDGASAEVCQRLDNLPLAIELAAARVKVLTPRQILARLEQRLSLLTSGSRDLPERQRTLRATIEWSYELLSADERQLFARLAIFRGGSTLEAAEQVAQADIDGLQSLVDKSLLRHRGQRFAMLETIREYASERLTASAEESGIRERHTRYFVDLVLQAEPFLREDNLDWLNRLEAENDNLRAVLDRLSAADDGQAVLNLAGRLQRFWYLKDYLGEGLRRLVTALAADERPTPARARALRGASSLAANLGDQVTSLRRAEEALALDREFGDAWGEAYSLMMVGFASGEAGNIEAAVAPLEQAVRLFEKIGDQLYTVISMSNLAWILEEGGDKRRARDLHELTLDRARAIGSKRMEAGELAQLAFFARDEGRLDDSISMLKEAIRINRAHDLRRNTALDLARLAHMFAAATRATDAARLLGASLEFTQSIGADRPWWDEQRNQRTLADIRKQLSEPEIEAAIAEGRSFSLDEGVALALGEDQPRSAIGT